MVGPSITRDLGWAAQWTYVGFSAALVAAVGLATLALSRTWTSYLAAWIILDFAKSIVLYDASFTTFAPVLPSASFAMNAFMWSGISVHLLSMLQLLGLAASTGVRIGSMIVLSQVLGRVGDMIFGSRVHPLTVLQFSSTVLPMAFAVLFLGQGSAWTAGLFAIGYGLSIGMNMIARGAVPLALFGTVGQGARLDRNAAPSFVAEAAAPIIYAAAIDGSGAWGGFNLAEAAAGLAWVDVLALSMIYRQEATR